MRLGSGCSSCVLGGETMKSATPLILAVLLASGIVASAQSDPSLENGFKAYGSYDGTNLFTVNVMNGGLVLHIPMPFTYPQRGGKIDPKGWLAFSSNNWQVKCVVPSPGSGQLCYWSSGAAGAAFGQTADLSVHRTWESETTTESGGNTLYDGFGYSLTTADGAAHQLQPNPNLLDSNGDSTSYDAIDTSGFHLDMISPDSTTGVPVSGIVTARDGNRYLVSNWTSTCQHSSGNGIRGYTISQICSQASRIVRI
jgi:hypothetical protein